MDTNKKRPHRFSEKIRQLEVDKTSLLFYARERAAANEPIEINLNMAKAKTTHLFCIASGSS